MLLAGVSDNKIVPLIEKKPEEKIIEWKTKYYLRILKDFERFLVKDSVYEYNSKLLQTFFLSVSEALNYLAKYNGRK